MQYVIYVVIHIYIYILFIAHNTEYIAYQIQVPVEVIRYEKKLGFELILARARTCCPTVVLFLCFLFLLL